MFGGFREARVLASRWKRASRSASWANASGSALMATSRSSFVSRARAGATLHRSRGVASFHLAQKRALRRLPIPIDGLGGDVQDMGCFVHAQAAKESQLDNLAH